jgi:hypothetical protein
VGTTLEEVFMRIVAGEETALDGTQSGVGEAREG